MSNIEIINRANNQIYPQYIPISLETVAYGSFSNTVSQTITSNTITEVELDTTEISNLVILDDNSKVYVNKTGLYKYEYSLQLSRTGNRSEGIEIYIRVNGLNVPRSATRYRLEKQNAEICAFTSYIIPLNAGDYIETIVYALTPNDNYVLTHFPATVNYPLIPSSIININQIA